MPGGDALVGFDAALIIDADVSTVEPSHETGPMAFGVRPTRCSGRRKRCLDLVSASLAILLMAPLLLLIALLVMTDGHAALFRQERVGRGGARFGCLKFRTMRSGAERALDDILARDPVLASEWRSHGKLRCDPRTTRVGRVLRRMSLDELPQLFNIVAGDMSLVGPRPVVADELLRHYTPAAVRAYMSVRPGLTGLWQVSGRSDLGYGERVALDCTYVDTLSLRNDVRLLVRTVGVLIGQRGAY